MTDPHIDVTRAARAKALAEDPLLIEAFKNLEDSYIAAWRTSPALADREREKLHVAINVVGKVQEHLQSIIANGRVAEEIIKRMTAEAA